MDNTNKESLQMSERNGVNGEPNGDVKTEPVHSVPNNEKAILLDKTHRVSLKTAVRLRKAAIGVSWCSVIFSFILGVIAIVYAYIDDSQSLFSFGLDSLLDCMSSVIVLWRFHGGESLYSPDRELRACILIGVLFIISSILLLVKSIHALAHQDHTLKPLLTLVLASVNVFICTFLGFSKIYLGRELESRALITDSIITLTGAVMAVFTLIFSAVYRNGHTSLWYLDDVFGIACFIFLFGYGIRVILVSYKDLKRIRSEVYESADAVTDDTNGESSMTSFPQHPS